MFRIPAIFSFICVAMAHANLKMFSSDTYRLYVVNATRTPLVIVKTCEAAVATFGLQIDDDAVSGCAVPVLPRDSCSTPLKPSGNDTSVKKTPACYGRTVIAVAGRGNCTFGQKASLALRQNYGGIIIWNNASSPAYNMAPDSEHPVSSQFLVVSVNKECGQDLMNKYNYTTDFSFIIQSESTMDLTKFLLPFVVILAVCIVVMLMAILIKCFRERRKLMKSRLSKGKLRQIPTRKFQKGEETDTCPICLDDFVEGDKLRVLPCNHLYHCKCVDPWLTKNRKVCPVCKRKVLPNDDDSSSDRDEPRRESESQPLLRSPDEREVGNSTFYSSFDSLHAVTVRGFVASSPSTSSLDGSAVLSTSPLDPASASSASKGSVGRDKKRLSRKSRRTQRGMLPTASDELVSQGSLSEPKSGSTINLIENPERNPDAGELEICCDNGGYSSAGESSDEQTAASSQRKRHRNMKSSIMKLSVSAPKDLPVSATADIHQPLANNEPTQAPQVAHKPTGSRREEIV